MCAPLGNFLQKIKIKIKGESLFLLKIPFLATTLVTIKYFITYGIVYTIMLVSLPYCLVKVKNWFLSPGQDPGQAPGQATPTRRLRKLK